MSLTGSLQDASPSSLQEPYIKAEVRNMGLVCKSGEKSVGATCQCWCILQMKGQGYEPLLALDGRACLLQKSSISQRLLAAGNREVSLHKL